LKAKLNKALRQLNAWLRPDAPALETFTYASARSLLERNQLSRVLSYRDFDQEDGLCYLDDGVAPAAGFVLAINPLLSAGLDAEKQFEAVFNACPSDTVVQFGKVATPQVRGFVDSWASARLSGSDNPLLRQIVLRRRDFMLGTAVGPSLLPKSKLHPRMMQFYVAVRVPFKGDPTDAAELEAWRKTVLDLRLAVEGALKGTQIASQVLGEADLRFLLRELLNPHLDPVERLAVAQPQVPMHLDLIDRNARVTVQPDGTLGFSGTASGAPEVAVTCITADAPPRVMVLPMMAQTLGNPQAWDERITCPYWAYTTVHVLDAEDAKDSLTAKFGLLNKQTMSESAWFRSMMGHLYERKELAGLLLDQTRKGHRLVRAYTGVNLYSPPEEARQQTEYVKGLWRRAGFRVSEEPHISLPVFLASLPLQYTPAMDPPNAGLQRATLMSSLNAASLLQIQGDWRGTPPQREQSADGNVRFGGGPLLVARSGQVACFDLLQTTSNYNFIVVAASGSGKSFLTNEIVSDFLSKGGMARIIDVGRSYHRFCSVMGGSNIVFSPDNPVSLNPFTGIRTQESLNEMMPMLKDLLRLMMFPLTPEEETPAFQYQLLEKAIQHVWERHNEQAELAHIYAWLMDYEDAQSRGRDLAIQLEPFATGRYSRWFSGKRTVDFSNPLVVVELEELKQDTSLQAVVLQLVMHQTTKEMYLADRRIPKLLAIDEAWDLMGGLKTGKFIETAFRRMRKYNGIAGVITQSYEDFERSPAARAAIENAAWQFVLYQRPESLEFAVHNKRIVSSDGSLDLMRTVRSGDGFSEVFVRAEQGSGLYRFVTDRHSYYTFTTKPADVNRITALTEQGLSIAQAIDRLATEDYQRMWGTTLDELTQEQEAHRGR
jgi:conjugal transfer ATP-binding protein TraC